MRCVDCQEPTRKLDVLVDPRRLMIGVAGDPEDGLPRYRSEIAVQRCKGAAAFFFSFLFFSFLGGEGLSGRRWVGENRK